MLFVSDKAGAVDLSSTRPTRASSTPPSGRPIAPSGRSAAAARTAASGAATTAARPGRHLTDRPGLPSGTLGKIGVAASPAQSGRVWALIEHATEGGLYRSDDYGDNWEKVSDNQNLVSRAWYYIHLTADPQDADTVYVNNLDFWKSSDGGKTFAEIATPHGDNHDLWIDPTNNQRMIQGNDGGANVSVNGGSFLVTDL